MDDATIVRTLAEFEGIDPVEGHKCKCGDCHNVRYIDHDGPYCKVCKADAPLHTLPDYLDDYNAVARVWKQAHQTPRCGIYGEARNQLKIDTWNGWFNQTPREHARALATAIAKHKENGNE